jgi:hypothetical protein
MRVKIGGQFLLLLLSLSVVNTARAQDIQTDYDRNFDLTTIKTFHFLQFDRGSNDPLASNPIVERRIRDYLTASLEAAGLQLSNTPDILIAYYGQLDEQSSWSVTGYGYGAGWRWGGGTGYIDQQTYTVGTVVVDFVSTQTNDAVWRATASRTVDPKKSDKNIRKGAEKLVKQFQKDIREQVKRKSG